MSHEFGKPVELQKLSPSEILHICCDPKGELRLASPNTQVERMEFPQTTQSSSIPVLRKLNALEVSHLKAAFYWLNVYNPEPETSRLEQVRGYLEAFHHLCEISAWRSAYQILFTPTKTADAKQLYEQLRSWGYYSEQIELFSRLLGKLDSEVDCFCLQGLGRAYAYLDRVPQAMSYYKQQLELAKEIGNRQAEAQALGGLVGVYSSLGQHQTVLNCLQKQLTVACEIKASKEEGQALGGLGAYAILRGNYRRGIKYCQQALAIAQSIDDEELSALVLGWMGGTYLSRGKYKLAIEYLQQQLAISTQIGNQCQRYLASYYLGNAYNLIKQPQLAIEYLSATLNFARETSSKATEASALTALGSVYADIKQYRDALKYYQQALEISRAIANPTTEAGILFNLCYCYGCLKQPDLAIEYLQQAQAISRETDSKEAKERELACLANLYFHQDRYFQSLWLVMQSLVILPPWTSANSRLILERTLAETIRFFRRLLAIPA
ncbi:tetratricopeptide repeat protein [Scytonema sp. UIC 10036]|uniref:tetratricopeptide repeat protein n=1 Tax=Scytonema sp. UIC 10036 TaxID=2304196 RepID=UPI0012DA5043|nr:tetratricopeptide repeat protein [Scytonema sp. UIC 10036]